MLLLLCLFFVVSLWSSTFAHTHTHTDAHPHAGSEDIYFLFPYCSRTLSLFVALLIFPVFSFSAFFLYWIFTEFSMPLFSRIVTDFPAHTFLAAENTRRAKRCNHKSLHFYANTSAHFINALGISIAFSPFAFSVNWVKFLLWLQPLLLLLLLLLLLFRKIVLIHSLIAVACCCFNFRSSSHFRWSVFLSPRHSLHFLCEFAEKLSADQPHASENNNTNKRTQVLWLVLPVSEILKLTFPNASDIIIRYFCYTRFRPV